MTTGFKCTADRCCWHPAPVKNGFCREHHRQAQLAQMRQSPSAAVRAAAWLLTQLQSPEHQATGAREAEPG